MQSLKDLKDRIMEAAEFNESLCNKFRSELLSEKDCTCLEPELGLCPYEDDLFDLRFVIRKENERLRPLIEALAECVGLLKDSIEGGEFTVGHCRATVENALAKLDERLKEME